MYMFDLRLKIYEILEFLLVVGSEQYVQVMNWKTKIQNTLKYSCRIYQLLVIEEDEMPTLIYSISH